MNRDAVATGVESLIHSDREWLVAALVASLFLLVVGTITQLGSMPVNPPALRVFAVQIAASFANHLLPAGAGGIAVNLRFLRRHGLSKAMAVGSIGFFFTLLFLFIRFLPMISIFEMRTILPEAEVEE